MDAQPDPGATDLRWLFAGQGPMGAAALDALASRCPPVAVLTPEAPWAAEPVTAAAADHDLPVRHVEAIGPDPARRWPDLFDHLDVAVCCCWAERLRPAALRAPEHGWLNLHPSALPRWRGADPIAWQMLTSPRRIPCSVHRMTEDHDEGPVVAEGSVEVREEDDRGSLQRRSGERLGRLAVDVLADLAGGVALRERAQDAGEATWCPPSGTVPMVDPLSMRAAAGLRIARAFSPQPGIAVASLPPDRRFAVTGTGRRRRPDEPPGSVAVTDAGSADPANPPSLQSFGDTPAEDVEIAFLDRWLRGRTWSITAGATFVPLQPSTPDRGSEPS